MTKGSIPISTVRPDDVILSAEYRIGPYKIESSVNEHPAVLGNGVGVVGAPDKERVEVVKAFVVLMDPSSRI